MIYQAFDANITPSDLLGAEVIIELDGLDGFLHIADRIAEIEPANVAFDCEYFLSVLEERAGKDAIKLAIRQTSAEGNRLKAYVNEIVQLRRRRHGNVTQRKRADRDFRKLSYEQIKQEIDDPQNLERRRLSYWSRWGSVASEDDLKRAAQDLLTLPDGDGDLDRILPYLDIFRRRVFPLDPHRLIAWAWDLPASVWGDDGRINDQARRSYMAFNALTNLRHPDVRDLAFHLMQSPTSIGRAVKLLAQNHRKGDWALIEEISKRPLERDAIHDLGFSVAEVFQNHPSRKAVGTLINLYERGPCSNCRLRFVKQLRSLDALPDWIAEECHHDSNLDLRDAINRGFATT